MEILGMNYGFVIDNRKCIGCHACSTACKAENEVPLGVNRTWVKYVEVGEFPHVRRHFQVTRCNHCANPPCVRICPTTAMFQRKDGIVEFDSDACIGCKACMQACPYDAIYIDPESHTAAKCHFCAHRTEIGLEPACVVVCPEHAILAGDMDDPDSEISRTLAAERVAVRKLEQGTLPKLFYIEGNDVVLRPTATFDAPRESDAQRGSHAQHGSKVAEDTYLWADVIPLQSELGVERFGAVEPAVPPTEQGGEVAPGGFWAQAFADFWPGGPRADSRPAVAHSANATAKAGGPIRIEQGRMAGQMVQVSYNAQHVVPWDWPVPAYLVTKAVGSGLFLLLAAWFGFDLFSFAQPEHAEFARLAGFWVLFFIALTAGLLILDLERPERFHYILLRPQWKSWLTRGAFILLSFSGIAGLWWLVESAVAWGWLNFGPLDALRTLNWWLGAPLAMGTAIYTAYLFGQAEGRDLWQSSLLPLHLLIQALLAGFAFVLVLGMFGAVPTPLDVAALWGLACTLLLNLFATFSGELGMTHASEGANQAAKLIYKGPYARFFWWIALGVGHGLPLLLLATANPFAAGVAGAAALVGLFAYEYVYVLAPQRIPNS